MLIFLVFSALGFLTAAQNANQPLLPTATSPAGPVLGASQRNLLLLKVDRLDEKRPKLLAAWGVGLFHSPNQNVVSFFPLGADLYDSQTLGTLYALNSDGSPTPALLRVIAARKIKISGYVIIDEEGYNALDETLRAQDLPVFTPPPTNPQTLLFTACQYLQGGGKPSPRGPQFELASLGSHLRSSLPVEQLDATWKDLLQGDQPPRCTLVEDGVP